jgi:hypothetical protein
MPRQEGALMIIITSKKINFRRCGVAHPKESTEYPDGKFSKKELKVLDGEPMLTVEYVDDKEIIKTPPPKDMTVAELKELLDKLEVPYDAKAKKDELIALVEENTGEPPKE